MTARSPRAGFTLLELLAATVLLSLVVGTITTLIVRQQRFYRAAAELTDVRRAVRETFDVLPPDLLGVAPQLDDIVGMTDSSIDFWAPVGSSALCAPPVVAGGAVTLVVPPATLAGHDGLSSFTTQPGAGDRLLVVDTASAAGSPWRTYALLAVVPGGGRCAPSGLTNGASGVRGLELTVPAPLHQGVALGAPVRVARRVHYSLYRSSADNRWYLGHRDSAGHPVLPAAWSTIQPVSGPYDSYAAGGLRLAYFDSVGTPLSADDSATRRRVRRIRIAVRASTRRPLDVPGLPRGVYADSLAMSVAPRNGGRP